MKTAAVSILCTMLAFGAFGQNYDSLRQAIVNLELNQKHIQLNLNKSHKEFSAGAMLTLAGAIMSGVYLHGRDREAGYKKPTLIYIGAGMSFVGAAIMVDSHKYISRAGKRIRLTK